MRLVEEGTKFVFFYGRKARSLARQSHFMFDWHDQHQIRWGGHLHHCRDTQALLHGARPDPEPVAARIVDLCRSGSPWMRCLVGGA